MNKQILLKAKRICFKIIGVMMLLIIWQLFANSFATKGMGMLLASPFQVIKRLYDLLFEPDFFKILGGSSIRIFSGFIAAFVLGIFLGIIAGEFDFIEDMIWPCVQIIKAVPVAAFVVILFIWFNTEITPILTFLIAFPVIYGNVLQGIKCADSQLIEVAKVYNVSYTKKLLFIKIPSVSTYLISACSTAIGMAWKAGIAAELIVKINNSIGEKLYDAKVYLINEDLLAWTVVIVIASILFEKAFILLLRFLLGRFYKI